MSEKTKLVPVATEEKINKALEFFYSLSEVKFTSDQEYENGVKLCRSVKKHIKEIESDRKDLVSPFNKKVSEINGECKGVINKLENAERVLKNGMGKYYQEKERKRLEEQRKLEAEAKEKRRKEEEAARKEAEKANTYRDLGRDNLAEKAEARAEAHQTIVETVVAPIITNEAKVKGTSFTTVYEVSVTDKKAAIEHMLMNDLLIQYLEIDLKGVKKLAAAQKGNLIIKGIRITRDQRVSIRS